MKHPMTPAIPHAFPRALSWRALGTLTCALALSGCASLDFLRPDSVVAAQPAPAAVEPALAPSSVVRTSRPRLAGQEIVVPPSGSAGRQLRPGAHEIGQRGALTPAAAPSQVVTLREAARAIVPVEYAIRPASCVPQQAPASWTRADSWVRALDQVMVAHNLTATVDHDLRQVLIDKPASLDPNAPRDWAVMRSDTTLRRALERWLTPACVQIEWDVPFPLDVRADRVYRGMDLWTALRTLAKELEESDTPIQIIHHPNVVRIASGQLR
jgi:hypothetical protein